MSIRAEDIAEEAMQIALAPGPDLYRHFGLTVEAIVRAAVDPGTSNEERET